MKWEALKEWSISFAIALVPFLLAFGVLLLPNHMALGNDPGIICDPRTCDDGCAACTAVNTPPNSGCYSGGSMDPCKCKTTPEATCKDCVCRFYQTFCRCN